MKIEIENMRNFINKGLKLESDLYETKEIIRKLSRSNYGRNLLDSRMIMTSILFELIKIKEGIPGITNESISQRIHLIASYMQGIDITETAISEGQYLKAAAIEKQNYEILTRIIEVKNGVEKEGETPQVRNMPENFRKIYGDLNKIAHPSNSGVILDLLQKVENGKINTVSYLPSFIAVTSKSMYELHLIIMFNIILESVLLLKEMHGENILIELNEKSIFTHISIVKDKLTESGAI